MLLTTQVRCCPELHEERDLVKHKTVDGVAQLRWEANKQTFLLVASGAAAVSAHTHTP